MASFLNTGASRGFGLKLARQLASLPATDVSRVFASARGDCPRLEEPVTESSGRLVVIKLDVTNEVSIKQAAIEVEAKLEGKGLDVLINNAGICQYAPDGVKSIFTVNVMGVHWVTRAFLPLLQKGTLKKMINISGSTSLGSITSARTFQAISAPRYKISKTATSSLTAQYALDYEKEGFTFMALCPGWMKTDLGGGDIADLTLEGAKASLDIIFRPGQELNGQLPKVFVKGWQKSKGKYQYVGGECSMVNGCVSAFLISNLACFCSRSAENVE
ncbi:short-chain dehydrogenase-like protein [Aspergillus coremiiformis]|uniref:Short-chain dehydrogenase-like protein n=1 Tax=Aspergillus coremiiformis TaxID=138285 RepID=A0A5N6YXY3_9EURO|nr:short-chain dehydrogenase-like protein [Aspergillus coremiiformis]